MSDRDFRLSKNVLPVRYDLRIDVDLDNWRFSAHEKVDVTVKSPTSEIILHAVDLDIRSATAHAGGRAHDAAVSLNQERETATFRFAEALPAGNVRIDIEFHGEILQRLRGFYRSEKDGRRYAATQFEAADARRAFPCFDEPEFKARFALTLIVPEDAVAISNGEEQESRALGGRRKEVRFAETPPISSYLVAYCIGPFDATPAETTPTGWPVRVVLPRGMADKGLYARAAHARSLTYLEDYTGIPYPYTKVDAIGVPDFEAGAMENPGAITYRLTAIAADEQRASTHSLKGIFYTAAHELTHMWWGDLVTMAWWDDLWLNESFATFVGYKAVADLMPEWGMWRDFVATLARPFALDALVSTHPISFEVKNAKQATERFDVITYWKGAGVVRMLEGFLDAQTFQKGVRTYLQRYRERNATADDFWRELSQASGRDVGAIANAWIREPGHPVVHVSSRSAGGDLELILKQERFYADPSVSKTAVPQIWPVPLVLKCGSADSVREERVLMSEGQMTLKLHGATWCFPNGGAAGFYRFTLDDATLGQLSADLQRLLEPHERLLLAGNQWALLKAGIISAEEYFRLLQGYRDESDRAVVSTITEQLGWLREHAVTDAALGGFESFVESSYRPQLDAIGWDPKPEESADDRLRRAAIVGVLGRIARSAAVVEEARRRLQAYLADPSSLDPNMVSTVAAIVATDGDEALYRRYLERKRQASADPEEEQRFLLALAAFERPEIIRKTLEVCLTDEVRAQDRTFLFASLLGRRAAREAAWAFVRDRWDELAGTMDPMLMQGLVRALSQLTPAHLARQVTEFLPSRERPETRETIAQVTEQLRIDSATVLRLQPQLQQALPTVA
jgi:puromycin-sensitive aminopeptidase